MSIERHPDISGNLTLTVPGAGSGGRIFDDVKEYVDYGGRFSPLGEPPRVGGDGSDEGQLWSLVTLASPGLPVDIAFYYQSHSRSNGPFGFRRTCSLRLYARGSGTPISTGPFAGHLPTVALTRGDDSTTVYKYDVGSGKFVCQSPESLNKLELVLTGPSAPLWVEKIPDGRSIGYAATKDGGISPILIAQNAVGNQHTFQYSSDGLLTEVEDAVGRTLALSYDSNGLLHTLEDWANRITSFEYDTQAQCCRPHLTRVTDASGHETQYEYDKRGRVKSVQDAKGYKTTYAYDSRGRVTGRTLVELGGETASTAYKYLPLGGSQGGVQLRVTDALTSVYTHTSDQNHRLVQWQSPMGHVLTYAYNGRGQESQRMDQHRGTWRTNYDADGLPHQLYDAKNRLTQIDHDAFANPTHVKRPNMGTQQMIWTSATYDPTGEKRRLQEEIDEVGNSTKYQYDSLGQVTEMMDALSHVTTTAYDELGQAISTLDWRLNETQYGYDLAGNVNRTEDADGKVSSFTYDEGDRQLTVLNALNQLSTNSYDALGNLTTFTDFRDNSTTYEHNIFDEVVRTLDPTNRHTAARYDKLGQQIATSDGLGHISTTTYDRARRPTRMLDPMLRAVTTVYDQTSYEVDDDPHPAHQTIDEWGNVSTTVYDAIGRVIGDIDPLNHAVLSHYDVVVGTFTYSSTEDSLLHFLTTTYDAAGRAVETLDYLGACTTTVYDALDRVSQFIDPLGQITTTQYDQLNNEGLLSTATIDAKGQRSTVSYDSLYRPIIQSDVAGNVTRTAYDALGRVEKVTDPALQSTTWFYDLGDAAQPAEAVVDARGARSTSIHDAAGRLVMSVDALSATSATSYDAAGRAESFLDPLGHLTRTKYDAASRVVETIDPLDNIVTTIYDKRFTAAPYANFPALATQDERGLITTQVYDAAGREVATQDADGQLWRTRYDQVNRPIASVDPLLKATTTTYDVRQGGSPAISVKDALGQISMMVYDLAGQVVKSIDVLGNTELFEYDALGRQTAMRDARLQWTRSEYDDIQQRSALVDAKGGRTTSVYESRGLLSATYDPLNKGVHYGYDATGDLIRRLDRNGVQTTYVPDELGRTKRVEYADGHVVNYLFDPAARPTGMTDWTGTTSYGYDTADRLTTLHHSNGKELVYTPDAAGNRRVLQDPQGRLTTYSYDALNRLVTIENPFGEVTTHTYDDNGRLETRSLANGVLETRGYDAIGRLVSLKTARGATLVSQYLTSYEQVLDASSGQKRWQQQVAELDGSVTTYLYDVEGQLVDASRTGSSAYRTTYAYDGLGNRLRQDVTLGGVQSATTYAYDAANQLVSSTQDGALSTYSYDANGNLLVRADGSGATTFVWDGENRLVRIEYPGGQTTGNLYTADGLRQSRSTSDGVTGYVWDGENVLEELDGSGAERQHYTDTPGVWGGLVSQKTVAGADATLFNSQRFNAARFGQSGSSSISGGSNYFGFDGSDDTRQMLDAGGGVTSTLTYLPFGEVIGRQGDLMDSTYAVAEGRFGYQQEDERLRYVRARYLDVVTGRWLSRDPLGFGGGDVNLYRNVGNDPINRVDPSGLWDQVRVHGKCTKQWAQEVYIKLGANRYLVFKPFAARSIGYGAFIQDDASQSAANIAKWYIHFNYSFNIEDDKNAVMGEGMKSNSDTRVDFFNQKRREAIDLARPHYRTIGPKGEPYAPDSPPRPGLKLHYGYLNPSLMELIKAMILFGRGLHATEDMFSHGDFSPAEHQDVAQEPYVDNPGYTPVNPETTETRVFRPSSTANFGKAPGRALEVIYGGRMVDVRKIWWRKDPSFSRMVATEADTKKRLRDFLRSLFLVNSPAVTVVKRIPDQHPGKPCGRYTDPIVFHPTLTNKIMENFKGKD